MHMCVETLHYLLFIYFFISFIRHNTAEYLQVLSPKGIA
jgi:hypothetical protein